MLLIIVDTAKFIELKKIHMHTLQKKGKLTFKIKKKKMIVKQKGKILSGVNLSGTYKLVQRYMHP